MKIPRYWAKKTQQVINLRGNTFSLICWRWSDVSFEEANLQAQKAIFEIARKIRNNEKLDRYSYGERPLREEIIEIIKNGEREPTAIITRNTYGALVLNTAKVMFVDIDFEREGLRDRFVSVIRKLVGQSSLNQEALHLRNIESWVRRHPHWGIRVYRTLAGLRCLVTHDVFDPTQANTIEVLESFQCDPLYIKLCRNQESFRARLTPKPWRCGIETLPIKYPWFSDEEEQSYRQWEERYSKASSNYTACKLIREIGNKRLHPEVEIIQSLHDKYTCSSENLKLA